MVFGHSWGSLIARAMATRPNARLDGLALGGVVAQLRGLETVSYTHLTLPTILLV